MCSGVRENCIAAQKRKQSCVRIFQKECVDERGKKKKTATAMGNAAWSLLDGNRDRTKDQLYVLYPRIYVRAVRASNR